MTARWGVGKVDDATHRRCRFEHGLQVTRLRVKSRHFSARKSGVLSIAVIKRVHRLRPWANPAVIVIWLAIAAMATFSTYAMARSAVDEIPPCVDPFEPDSSVNPQPALNSMRRFAVVLGPYKLSVPWAYFSDRPRANLPSCKLDIKRLAIRFRFSEGTSLSTGEVDYSYDRKELWNKAPADLVEVQALQFYEQTPESYFDPSLRYRNTLRGMTGAGSIRTADGLEKIKPGWSDREGTHWYLSTNETDAFISCDLIDLCTGFINLKDLRLSAHIILKRQSVRKIRAIDVALRSLISNWQENK